MLTGTKKVSNVLSQQCINQKNHQYITWHLGPLDLIHCLIACWVKILPNNLVVHLEQMEDISSNIQPSCQGTGDNHGLCGVAGEEGADAVQVKEAEFLSNLVHMAKAHGNWPKHYEYGASTKRLEEDEEVKTKFQYWSAKVDNILLMMT
ncbi:hypothetical protein U9M48_005430 [Paspalum notatum var. saurae]|uniref:Uncharacterized protein n=1 Tax=Paspalum notatum var. saurae TaxID=547442 RepID=A0AAQ3PQ68_PASNO